MSDGRLEFRAHRGLRCQIGRSGRPHLDDGAAGLAGQSTGSPQMGEASSTGTKAPFSTLT